MNEYEKNKIEFSCSLQHGVSLHITFKRRGLNSSGLKGLLRTLEVFQPLIKVNCHQRESLLQCYQQGNENNQKLNFYIMGVRNIKVITGEI